MLTEKSKCNLRKMTWTWDKLVILSPDYSAEQWKHVFITIAFQGSEWLPSLSLDKGGLAAGN
jgi:hypothetical protein